MADSPSYEAFPSEYRGLLEDFQKLLETHPGADKRFAIADLGNADAKTRLSGRAPDWDCVSTRWGVVCKPFSKEV